MILAARNVSFPPPNAEADVRMGVPGGDWSRDELDARAVWENEQIKPRQRHATHYWFLGKVLLAVGRDFDPAQWRAWREAHQINRTRCERAQLIAQAFRLEQDVANLPVLVAVALARERLGRPPRQTAADARLRRSLSAMNKSLAKRLDEFDRVTDPDGVPPLTAELKRQLTEIEHRCAILEKRPATAAGKRPKKPR